MSAILPRDPLPGKPLLFRVDTRTGPDCVFWCRVRQAFLPRLRGHCFWVSSHELPNWEQGEYVQLPRQLMLQYTPEFVRLSPREREHIRRFCIERDATYVRDNEIARGLKSTGLAHGRTLTIKGQNAFHLSP